MITEEEAIRFLELEKESLRALAAQGPLNVVEAEGPQGQVRLYHRSEILKLKVRIDRIKNEVNPQEGEWTDLIEVD